MISCRIVDLELRNDTHIQETNPWFQNKENKEAFSDNDSSHGPKISSGTIFFTAGDTNTNLCSQREQTKFKTS
jgi:hypothetical protein